MPPRCNDKGFQNKVIDFIGERLGIDAYASFEGNWQRTQLNSVLKEAASFFNFGSAPQMRRWWYYFQQNGYVPAEKTKYKRTSKRMGKRTKKKSQWTSAHTQNLQEIIDDDPDLYLDELQFVFWELGHGHWSASYLWEKLTMEVGYSLQVAADKSYAADCEERREFIQALKDRIIHPRQLILMDESQKDRNSSRRRRSWSKKGSSPSRHAYFDGDGMRYTFLAVADIDGFIFDGCSTIEQAHGAEDSNTTRGTVDQERFELYIKEKVIPLMGRYDKCEPRSILVIDNASIHQRIRELIEHPDVGGKVIFTAPYSPDLNPIELMFHSYKAALKRHSGKNVPWDVAHAHGIMSVTPDIARSYFKKCGIPRCDHYPSQDEIETRKRSADLIEMVGVATIAKVAHLRRNRRRL